MLFIYIYTQEITYFLAASRAFKQTITKVQQHGSV